jgi:hypothetical protein
MAALSTIHDVTDRSLVRSCNLLMRYLCVQPIFVSEANALFTESVFLKIHGARCGVEKGTQMGGLLGGEG